MENIFWVKLVRPFKLSSRIARDLIVSQYPVKKGEKKKIDNGKKENLLDG